MRSLTYLIAAACTVALGYWFISGLSDKDDKAAPSGAIGGPIVEIRLPDALSDNATIGQTAYTAKCAACHGENAVGQDGVAPPLVHKIYEPSHHADASFHLAVMNGVRQHHWSFGDMPPVTGLTRGDVTMIIAYVRELQQANGIR